MDSLTLQGFSNLDPSEIKSLEEVIAKKLSKIKFKTNYEGLRVELKQHKHSKEFIHEIKAVMFLKSKRMMAQDSDKNIYKALNNVFDKLITELGHLDRKQEK